MNTDHLLTTGAIEHLKALAQKTGLATPDLQGLWDAWYVIGSHTRTHITAQGKKIFLQLMAQEQGRGQP
jgi:hypothetical protein